MNDGISWNQVFSIVATLFGVLASALMGMAVARLRGIEQHLADMNGKLFGHLTNEHYHGAGFAKVEEQISALFKAIAVAHTRVDRLAEKRED